MNAEVNFISVQEKMPSESPTRWLLFVQRSPTGKLLVDPGYVAAGKFYSPGEDEIKADDGYPVIGWAEMPVPND